MKYLILIAAVFLTGLVAGAKDLTLEDVSPHLSTKTQIIWLAPTQHLPKNFSIYKKTPRVFSATTISNAIVLASFQAKGFPKPCAKPIVIWADHPEGEPRPPSFSIIPEMGEIFYTLGDRAPDSSKEYLTDGTAIERAWDCLARLGVDRKEFIKTNAATEGDWGVYFPRQIDGIEFYAEAQGFSFQQFGSKRTIRCFFLAWPNLERSQTSPIASTNQIIACIKAHKTALVPPKNDEFNYFDRLKLLSKTTKLTIVKITPYYSGGVYGKQPEPNEQSKIVCPIAELEAIAEFGSASNLNIQLLSPIVSSEVTQLLNRK